jgi:hypothetical protein
MKLYHGTQEWKANCIDQEGFLGGELDSCTVGRQVDGGVVYFAETIEEANEYGDIVFEVDLEGVEVYPFTDGNTQHFYALANEVNGQASWERIK